MPGDKPKRSDQVSVRLRDSERELIEQAAERRGLHTGTFMRSASLGRAREITDESGTGDS